MQNPSLSRRQALGLGVGLGAGTLVGVLPATTAQAGAQRTVAYEYVRQQTQSWCSAASSFIALSSRRNPTQAGLARDLGLSGGSGLQDPLRIAAVLNQRLGLTGAAHRYVFRQPPAGTLKERLRMRVVASIDAGHAVVINMDRVAGDTYSAGHYVAIVGYRDGAYKIADPDEPTRKGVWFGADDVVAWNKLNRFTAFS
ncbi:C39 family peptidase [Microlunatus capsulatus]|uniref:Peptidase C39-like domain-containing protein n=1 Tax=Microlunatus capsulatus TaxID=99117 RepID=A0ABS4Z434_9ACTN|nr:C39 family peptidase [Microlunatus capsulatus]MBP2415817.1 hypothetical protein [Microlunatus capsulatus]